MREPGPPVARAFAMARACASAPAALLAVGLAAVLCSLAGRAAATELADPGSSGRPRPAGAPTPGFVLDFDRVEGGASGADGFRDFVYAPAAGAPAGQPARGPTLAIRPIDRKPWDAGRPRSLKLHLQNPMPWPLTLQVRLRDAGGRQLDATVGLQPGPPVTFVMPVDATRPLRWGMRSGPPMPWRHDGEPLVVALTAEGRVDTGRLTAIELTLPAPDSPQRLRIGKVFVETSRDDERLAYDAIVDAFGQYTRADWPQKLAAPAAPSPAGPGTPAAPPARSGPSPAVAPAASVAPAAAIAPLGPERALAATGFYRTERRPDASGRERWWLVDPRGRPFFSLGVNAIQFANSDTIVEGREAMFAALPADGSPLARFYGRRDSTQVLDATAGAQRGRGFADGRSFDFYRANLWRRDGDGFERLWPARTAARLAGWGFNTAGSWSDDGLGGRSGLAQTPTIHIEGAFARLSDGHDWWSGMPDPFDPRFEAQANQRITQAAAPRRDDPNVIGWFVDNELAWGGDAGTPRHHALARAALAGDGRAEHAHAKRAFVALLEARHGSAAALSKAWHLPIRDWSSLLAPMPPNRQPELRHPAVAADFSAFLALHADRYFRIVATALKNAAPNHLFLGSRFAGLTPEALAACARWCDVVSFNRYVPDIASGFDGAGFARLGKPAMLTEFHFGAADRGPFWSGVMAVARSDERGAAYARFLASVVDNPDFVGAHWFQYLDQPVTGRWLDGENGHLGLVSITDTPWQPFVDEVARANRDAFDRLRRLFRP